MTFRESLPTLPYNLQVVDAYHVGAKLALVAKTEEAYFVAYWDGISTSFESIEAYPRVNLDT